ncbi:enoyl-CoA hydratase/isomerase family protein [Kocuria palustris]|uniref:enoyl-CoA hydratase/isomerase family protein n=1 Tax=Kocuria palustris TaxID=71999 RepID=UPI0011A3AAFA|nr:enoyl-CoA hydratase/isomerase family protein [Kocuria palustris]
MTQTPATEPAPDPEQHVRTEVRGGTGVITLDRPKALNALTARMYRDLLETLWAWQDDDAVTQVLITSSSPRAFCAGGDIRQIREAVLDDRHGDAVSAFADEYTVDALIARYPKPFVAIMQGITMGGGMGLSVHGSHRIVTDDTVMAMPEAAIGFFPDIGASWFLPRVSLLGRGPSLAVGRWLGLTGARLSGADALAVGLADNFVPSSRLEAFTEAVISDGVAAAVAEHCAGPGENDGIPEAELPERWDEIEDVYGADTLGEVLVRAPAEDLEGASPTSLVRTWELLERGAEAESLTECLERELALAADTVASPDFAEGVRCAMVDKEDDPQWTPPTVAEVDVVAVRRVLDQRGQLRTRG